MIPLTIPAGLLMNKPMMKMMIFTMISLVSLSMMDIIQPISRRRRHQPISRRRRSAEPPPPKAEQPIRRGVARSAVL